jgi:hypothetical protein
MDLAPFPESFGFVTRTSPAAGTMRGKRRT